MTEQDLLAQPPADYMNEAQQGFFRELLLTQRNELQVRIEGEFIWHAHPETDEAFLVLEGTLRIDLPGRSVHVVGKSTGFG